MKMTALITGAGSGIGYELAKCFARDGHDLVLLARNETRLMEVAEELRNQFNIQARVLAMDLSDPETPQAVYDILEEEAIEIDCLVNNAGYAETGCFAASDLSEQLDLLEVNVSAPMILTHLFLEGMLEREYGGILNVGSTVSFVAAPKMAVYGAAKSFVLAFSEALAAELKATKIRVTCLCPGATRTGFVKRAKMEDARMAHSALVNWMSPESVARQAYTGFLKGRRIVVPGISNRALLFLNRLMPRRLSVWFTETIMGLNGKSEG
jgi:uncharacterized protein